MSIYIVIPALCIAGVNAWRLWSEHWEHKAHEPPVEERTEYPYMNIRTKNFFWGDGDKVSDKISRRGVGEGRGAGRMFLGANERTDTLLEYERQLPQEGGAVDGMRPRIKLRDLYILLQSSRERLAPGVRTCW